MPDAEKQFGSVDAETNAETAKMDEAAVGRFLTGFKGLCRSEDDRARLKDMADRILQRWGYHGCDMVSAFHGNNMVTGFQYQNISLERLEKAVDTYVRTSESSFQLAIEQFWWLMGIGGYADLLHDSVRFEDFRGLMEKEGLMACRQKAAEIRGRINEVTGSSD
jgi:hypothetical protein